MTLNSTTCVPRDECATDNGGCAHKCTNTPTGFECSCFTADDNPATRGFRFAVYELSDNTYDCLDIDECTRYADELAVDCNPAAMDCINQPGFFSCIAKRGAGILAKSGVIENTSGESNN